jgi:hypothetical protein
VVPRLANRDEVAALLSAFRVRLAPSSHRADTVVVMWRVATDGRAVRQSVAYASSPAAGAAVRQVRPYLRYVPARRGGHAVAAHAFQEIDFPP